MSEETWKVQASYKHGDREQHMLNVRGVTAADLKSQLAELDQHDVLSDVVTTGLTLGALTTVTPLTQPAPVTTPPPPPFIPAQPTPAADPWATATPATPAPPAPAQNAAPTCVHGPRQYKSGVGAKGPWQAWMCGARRDDPTKCEPQWIR